MTAAAAFFAGLGIGILATALIILIGVGLIALDPTPKRMQYRKRRKR